MSLNRASLLASLLFALAACTTPPPAVTPPVTTTPTPTQPPKLEPKEILRAVSFASIPGWSTDDLREAWPAFMASCDALVRKSDWKEPCTIARDIDGANEPAVRLFFESFFTPWQVLNADGSDNGLITGYYEPMLRGSRKRGGPYQTPLHRVPEDLLTIDLSSVYPELKNMRLRGRLVGNKVVPYATRGEMQQANALSGKELIWVDDPIEAFFLQVQGSGRVQLAESKEVVRIAYADQNGHPYKSIGRYLVDKGEMTLDQASAQNIKAWYASHPARQQELLNANPSYVFFKEEKIADPSKGPKGALGVPLTPQRSIAVDPQFIPLGAPVFVATTQPGKDVPLQRLMTAQDTGGAIRGAVRADFFWGLGTEAGERAGRMKQRGMLWVLMPKLAPVNASVPQQRRTAQ
ncbi:murein transglycosylase [Oxalobacteraceae bacterium OM1]|nr:murein transglycosylase [Oxalobacteraceae bacterium OM1]